MTDKIKLVRHDTRPVIVCTITDDTTGSTINITGCTINLFFRAVGSTTLQATVVGSITDGANGQVTFYPSNAPEMLSGAAGDYEGEIQILFTDGSIQTLYDTLKFKVRDDF
jgi:hypothetical protein